MSIEEICVYSHRSSHPQYLFVSSRRRQTRCALVTGVQTCALPIYRLAARAQVEHDRIARQVDAGYLLDPCGDIAADDQRLALRRRQEDLVARFPVEEALADLHHRFAGEIPTGADLPRFLDLARALVAVVPP